MSDEKAAERLLCPLRADVPSAEPECWRERCALWIDNTMYFWEEACQGCAIAILARMLRKSTFTKR